MSTGRHNPPSRQFARALGTGALAAFLVAAQTPLAFAQSPTEAPAIATDSVHQGQHTAFRDAMIATVAGNAFDAASTVAGIQGGRLREANPVLGQSPARIILMKSLLTVPTVLAEKQLADQGHPKAARWLGYTVGGFAAALAIRNVRLSTR